MTDAAWSKLESLGLNPLVQTNLQFRGAFALIGY